MNIKAMKTLYYIVIIVLISCHGNIRNDNNQNQKDSLNLKGLIMHKGDLSVYMALKSDTLYRQIEKHVIEEEGGSQEEAEEWVQFMIDNKLIMEPQLDYFTDNGRRTLTLSYQKFKKYIKIIKDSVAKQPNEEFFQNYLRTVDSTKR